MGRDYSLCNSTEILENLMLFTFPKDVVNLSMPTDIAAERNQHRLQLLEVMEGWRYFMKKMKFVELFYRAIYSK